MDIRKVFRWLWGKWKCYWGQHLWWSYHTPLYYKHKKESKGWWDSVWNPCNFNNGGHYEYKCRRCHTLLDEKKRQKTRIAHGYPDCG